MQIQLTRNVTALGRAGQVRTVDAKSGRVLVLLGMAEVYVAPPPKPKRVYRRKDIVPEPDLVAEDPTPEPDIEPDATEQDDDDAAVRLGD